MNNFFITFNQQRYINVYESSTDNNYELYEKKEKDDMRYIYKQCIKKQTDTYELSGEDFEQLWELFQRCHIYKLNSVYKCNEYYDITVKTTQHGIYNVRFDGDINGKCKCYKSLKLFIDCLKEIRSIESA